MQKSFELAVKTEVLRDFRQELRQLLEEAGWHKKALDEFVLAVDEALVNVARHAYDGSEGAVKIFFEDQPDRTMITIEDHGKKFDPTKVPEPKLPRHEPGGLGVHFIRTIMDEFVYDGAFAEGNRLYMAKKKSNISKGENEL